MRELTSKTFWADVGVRAIRTMAQTAVGVISAGAVLSDVDWIQVASASALAGVVSVLMSLDRIGSVQKERDTQ
ncbi:MAG: holin [Oscillibacter sp.]|nr:holin [Oscillibacter sp.]